MGCGLESDPKPVGALGGPRTEDVERDITRYVPKLVALGLARMSAGYYDGWVTYRQLCRWGVLERKPLRCYG